MPLDVPQFTNATPPPMLAAPPPVAAAAPAPAPMAPAAPAPMAQPGPQMPSFARPDGAPPRQGGGWSDVLSAIPALLGGMKDPRVLGAALAGLQRGKDRKRELLETQQQKEERMQAQRAEFYGNVLAHASQFDDEIALNEYLNGVRPMAKYYNVPLVGITIPNDKKAAKDRRLASDAIDVAVRRIGPEILNQDNYTIYLSDGRPLRMSVARSMLGGNVTDEKGKAVPVASPFKANTAAEMRLVAYAKAKGKRLEDLTPEELDEAKGGAADDTPNTDYSRFLVRWAKDHGKTLNSLTSADEVAARKAFGQADDQPRVSVDIGGRNPREVATFNQIAGAYERSPLIRAADRTIVLNDAIKAIEKNPADPASQLSLAYSYVQALDTYQSAVREGELQNLGMLGTKLQQWTVQLNRVANEGAFLPPEVAKNIAASARQLVSTIESGQSRKQQEFASRARTSGVGDMWDEFVGGFGNKATQTGGNADTALSELERRRKAQGGR